MADGTVRGELTLSSEAALRGLHSIRDAGREADTALERLGRRLDEIGAKRVHPKVDLTGITEANAKLSELEARLDRIGAKSYTPRVGIGASLAGMGGGGGGRGAGEGLVAGGSGTPLFGSVGGMAGRLPWWAMLSPLIPQAAGGLGALGASAGSAALGAGVVGLGGMASLGAGAGLSMAIARPAITALGEITKAQDAYNKAVQEYGRQSTQAATAARNMNQALVSNPMAAGAARQLGGLRTAWQSATAPARAAVYGGVSTVLYNARQAVPTVSTAATVASRATAGAAGAFSGFLAQPAEQAMLLQLTGSFARELPTAERSLENIATVFGHLAVDALPFFHEANQWVERWTTGLAQQSADQPRVQAGMDRMVTSARAWARLAAAAGRDIKDLFSPGVQPGNSMVGSLTQTLDRWDTWLRDNPDKVRQFFRDGVQGVSRIATVIGNLAADVWNIFRALNPILSRAESFLSFTSGLGGGSLLAGAGLLYGGYQGARGALGGRGPSAGGLATAFITGSQRGLMGGGAAGAGTVAATEASSLGRASNLEVQRGVTSGGAFLMGGATVGPQAVIERRAAAGETGSALSQRVARMVDSSPLAARVADAASTARSVAIGAFAGVARFAAPLLALNGVLGAMSAQGGVSNRLGAGLSQATLGLIPQSAATHIAPAALAALPGAALSRFAPSAMAGLTRGTLGRIIGPQALEALGAPALGALGGVALGGVGAYAGFLAHPAVTGASLGNPTTLASTNRLIAEANAVRTPEQLRAVQGRLSAAATITAELDPRSASRLRAELQRAAGTAAQNAGAYASNSWETAFTRGIERGTDPNKAIRTMLGGMQSQITALGPRGARNFAQDTAKWVQQMEADNPRLQRPLEKLMSGIVADINRMNNTVGDSFKELQNKTFYFNGQILTGAQTTWGKIRDAMVNPSLVAQEKLSGIWGTIQKEAINALTQMGFSGPEARTIVTQTARGGNFAANQSQIVKTKTATGQTLSQGGANTRFARGGMIGGDGLLDTVQLPGGAGTAAPGEAWIANRHTMNALSSATIEKYGKTAWEMIRDEGRPHSQPPRYALGGNLAGVLQSAAGAVSNTVARSAGSGWVQRQHPELHPGIAQAVEDVLSRFPLSITSTTRGGHASGSYHYLGEAADISGASSTMLQAAGWINSSGLAGSLTEGIHNPNLSVKFGKGVPSSFWGPAVWGEHANHIHMAVAGALSAAAAGGSGGAQMGLVPSLSLRAPGSGLRGIPGAMADQSSRMYAAGLQNKLNAVLGAAGSGISAAGWSGGGSNTANQQLGHRMMLAAGWGEDQWPALQALWNQESGWSSTVVNKSSGAAGIPQALGHGHPFNLGDAPAQIAWGLNYIRGRYGSPAAAEAHERSHNWYSRGGRVNWAGWNARGGTFTTNGPTLFGAGEKGRETVSIGHGGNGRHITVNMEHVHLGSGSAQELEAVAQDVAGRIIDALDRTSGGASDSQLAGV